MFHHGGNLITRGERCSHFQFSSAVALLVVVIVATSFLSRWRHLWHAKRSKNLLWTQSALVEQSPKRTLITTFRECGFGRRDQHEMVYVCCNNSIYRCFSKYLIQSQTVRCSAHSFKLQIKIKVCVGVCLAFQHGIVAKWTLSRISGVLLKMNGDYVEKLLRDPF